MKSTCLFCGDEFEYEEQTFFVGTPPERKFCGDSCYWTEYPRCLRAKEGLPEPYKSYVWLCKIYHQREKLQPYKGDNWLEHYHTLSAQYDADFREYFS